MGRRESVLTVFLFRLNFNNSLVNLQTIWVNCLQIITNKIENNNTLYNCLNNPIQMNNKPFSNISWKTIEDKIAFVRFYSQFGMDCTHISGKKEDINSFKNPSNVYITNGIEGVDWEEATGIGINLGKDSSCLRCIDIDGYDFHCREHSDEYYYRTRKTAMSIFIHKCLSLLGLPDDYEWFIKTPNGYHILFYASDFGFDFVSLTPSKYFENSNPHNVISIKGIDLLWNTHLVMPPTIIGFKKYEFIYGLPSSKPREILIGDVFDFINYFCGTFEYTLCSDRTGFPVIYNAYFFPYYNLECNSEGSFIGSYFEYNPNSKLTGNNRWLMECNNSAGYNTLGISLIKQDLAKNGKIMDSIIPASLCFQKANDSWGNYNLACMMALGLIEGDINKLHHYLDLAVGFPDNHKDSLTIQYLSRNNTK